MGVLGYIGEALSAGKSFVEGLAWTMREIFQEPVTVQYPDQPTEVTDWFRGIPVQKSDLSTGYYKCTSCGLCVEACPVNVITLEWHTDPDTKKKLVDRFAIDMSRCMLCNYCIEACPFDSLVMAKDFELSKINPDNMVYEMEDLLRIGLKYSKADDPNVKLSKLAVPPWVFAEITGATEENLPEGSYLGMHPLPKRLRAGAPAHAPAAAPAAGPAGQTTGAKANPTPENLSGEAGPAQVAAPKAPETAEAPAPGQAAGEGEAKQ